MSLFRNTYLFCHTCSVAHLQHCCKITNLRKVTSELRNNSNLLNRKKLAALLQNKSKKWRQNQISIVTSLDVLNKHMLSIFYSGLEIKLKHTWPRSKIAYAYKKKRVVSGFVFTTTVSLEVLEKVHEKLHAFYSRYGLTYIDNRNIRDNRNIKTFIKTISIYYNQLKRFYFISLFHI